MKTLRPVERLSNRVIRLLGLNPGPFTLQGTNTYLVGNGKERILIDTGECLDSDDKETSSGKHTTPYTKNLLDVIHEEDDCRISDILLTHHHADHIGGVNQVIQALGYSPNVWKLFGPHLSSTAVAAPSGSSHREKHTKKDSHDTMGDGEDNSTTLVGEKGHHHVSILASLTSTSKLLEMKDGQIFRIPGCEIEVITTPGHTSDHISLLLREENAIFSGDCILGENSSAVFENLHTYMKSLAKLKERYLSFETNNRGPIYPGHGDLCKDPVKKINHYIMHRTKRIEQVHMALKKYASNNSTDGEGVTDGKGVTDGEGVTDGKRVTDGKGVTSWFLTEQIYAASTPQHLLPAAERNLTLALDKLVQDGLVLVKKNEHSGELQYFLAESDEDSSKSKL
eukprot:g1651.t1